MKEFLQNWEAFALPIGIMAGTVFIAIAGHYVLFKVLERLARRTETTLDDSLVRHCRGPARIIIPLLQGE